MGDIRLRVVITIAMLCLAPHASTADWITAVKACVARKNFDCATSLVNAQLRTNPLDVEARTWHARLLAWTGSWEAAENEYKAILAVRHDDIDALLDLADVKIWDGKFTDALATLDRAERVHGDPRDIWVRRGRIYIRLHRELEAVQAYRSLLQVDPGDHEARSALTALREPRHELRTGSDTDTLNYTNPANAETLSLTSRWNQRWSTKISTTLFQRFAEHAETANAGVTYRFTENTGLR